KQMGKNDFARIPNGHPAIEHRVELLFSEGVQKGRISLSKFVELISTNPAKLFGMYPRKGTLAVGADADVAILNPKAKHVLSAKTHHMRTDYSAYEGRKVTGKVETVILRGNVAIENDKCLLEPGFGKFIPRRSPI